MNWREDLAWAAGILDGEGCFYVNRACRGRPRDVPVLRVGQSSSGDPPQMLLRLQEIFGFGTISRGYVRKDRNSPTTMYFWDVGALPRVQAVLAMVWPWLGDVKRQQAVRALRAETPIKRPGRRWGNLAARSA